MSKYIRHNGGRGPAASPSPVNRLDDKFGDDSDTNGIDPDAEQEDETTEGASHQTSEPSLGKILLGVTAAVVAIAATEYALQKYTKTGGIIPHLLRLEKISNAYLAEVEGE